MDDVKEMLAAALDHGPEPGQPVNPAPDLARGRRLQRRRRLTGVAGAACGAAAAAGVAAAVLTLGSSGPAATHPAPAPVAGQHTGHQTGPAAPAGKHPARPGLKLVSYQGYQAPGYQVAEVPRGWAVQGGNESVLVIAPRFHANGNVDVFIGKIAVMLKSADQPAPTGTPNLLVDGRPGFLSHQDHTSILLFRNKAGQWVDIQFPDTLGWDRHQFARFAAGVQVLGNAQPGRG
jgi:hypothetical protein